MEFAIALKLVPAHVRAGLRSKLALELDNAADTIANILVDRIDNRSTMVIQADPVGTLGYRRPGRWGVDEPDPFA